MKSSTIILASILTIFLGTTLSAQNKTLVLKRGLSGYVGVADTYIDQPKPDDDQSKNGRLEIRNYPGKDGAAGELAHALIRFDLSGIPANAVIQSAKLKVFALRTKAKDTSTINILKVTSEWNESHTWTKGIPSTTISGVTAPTPFGLSEKPAAPEPFIIEQGLKDLIQAWVKEPATNFGIMLQSSERVNFRLASSESKTPDHIPELTIEYSEGAATPPAPAEPAAAPAGGEKK